MSRRDFTAIASEYWASFFDCPVSGLFAEPCRIGSHGPELEDYWGASALFRDGSAMISVPPDSGKLLEKILTSSTRLSALADFADAFGPVSARTVGPASIGYTFDITGEPNSSTRSLEPSDAVAIERLESACDPEDWETGGSPSEHPCSGSFVDGQLAALAGYEIWGGTIAHISIVTHPAFRGQGHGRSAVAHLAGRALASGLLPQYRTLERNAPSIAIAESLGFQKYAVSMAVRFSPDGTKPADA